MKLGKGVGSFGLRSGSVQYTTGMFSDDAHQIGIPHPYGILHAYFTHQETVHPPERELHELDVL